MLFSPETFNLAEVTRGIEVARSMGPEFRCIFSGYSRRFSSRITDAGFEFRFLEPELTDREADLMLDFDQGRSRSLPFTPEMLKARVENERRLIRELLPEAVVIGTTISQLVSARAEGVPLIYVKPFAYSSPHLLGLKQTSIMPRESRFSRFIDSAAASLVRLSASHITYIPKVLRDVAKANGVRPPKLTAKLLDADLNLLTTIPELAPPDIELPADHRWVGPIFASLPGALPEIVQRLACQPTPLVYVAMGSSGNRRLILSLLHALGTTPAQFLAPVAHFLKSSDLPGLPANVNVCSWLPTQKLIGLVDMAITHGGEGTVQMSCVAGWPFIGIPLQFEQRYNVQVCVKAGVAQMVLPQNVSKTNWAKLIDSILHSPDIARRAKNLSALLTNTNGPERAASEIRLFLKRYNK